MHPLSDDLSSAIVEQVIHFDMGQSSHLQSEKKFELFFH